MLNIWSDKLQEYITTRKILKHSNTEISKEIEILNTELDTLQKVREVFQNAAKETQNFLKEHLSIIVSNAVKSVFPENEVEFCVDFIERRNSIECDMYFRENEREFSLFDSRGYGMTDIASFAVLVAYIILHNKAKVIIIDEPFRNLHITRHELASKMVHSISEELEVQFVIATHIEALKKHAHRSFNVEVIDKKSIISLNS